jgi:FAD synthetase
MQKIVLVGGCFDILHIGHITFLEKAKKAGDYLIVLLESDQAIQKLKGKNRPINSQADRAKILSSLKVVDKVIALPVMKDLDYDELVKKIKPAVIATTSGDSGIHHKKRAAKLVGAKVKVVTKNIKDQSTTNLVKLLSE